MPSDIDEELIAVYMDERLRFHNAESDHVILEVQPKDDQPCAAVGDMFEDDPDFQPGLTYRFFGSWTKYQHPKGGPLQDQFAFNSFAVCEPHSQKAMKIYLMDCDGIGIVLANILVETYGDDTIYFCRNNPKVVANEIGVISLSLATKVSEELEGKKRTAEVTIELLDMFGKHGFPKRLVKEVIRDMGTAASRKIRERPYLLLDYKGVGWIKADTLYQALGHDLNALERQARCAWYQITLGEKSGNTWFGEDVANDAIDACIAQTLRRPAEAIDLAIEMELLSQLYTTDGDIAFDGDVRWLAQRFHCNQERIIAKRMIASREGRLRWPCMNEDEAMSDHQKTEVESMLDGRVCILSGSPGTGKTFVAARIIREIIKEHGTFAVAVACPTGKARVRIAEVMHEAGLQGIRIDTWHGLLKVESVEGSKFTFFYGAKNPLPYKFIIGDESSMVTTYMMAKIFQAMGKAHLMLVGDVNQLSPVGHGAPFRDMLDAGIPSCELTEIRRNSGHIVEVCHHIKNGEDWEVIDSVNVFKVKNDITDCDENNLTCVPAVDATRLLDVINQCCDRIRDHSEFDEVWDVQILVPTNDTRKSLNDRLRVIMNHDNYEDDKKFCMGEKVICTKNGGCKLDSERGLVNAVKGDEAYVANGEIGEVLWIDDRKRWMSVQLGTPDRTVKVFIGGSGEDKDRWELAYAITGHKSQGSEFPVALVVLEDSIVCDRAWLYTAISRAKTLCVMIGDLGIAYRMCQRNYLPNRKTFLAEQLIG